MAKYTFYVSADNGPNSRYAKYNGDQVADAMAEWSKAVSEGAEYIVIEALREVEP